MAMSVLAVLTAGTLTKTTRRFSFISRGCSMQTFLPYKSFKKSAQVLDRQRLGKQRVECVQILNVLLGLSTKQGWKNHPAVLMWDGYEKALLDYLECINFEWLARGYKSPKVSERIIEFQRMLIYQDYKLPPWLGDPLFHISHQSNLVRKNAVYAHIFPGVPSDLDYVWPVKKGDANAP